MLTICAFGLIFKPPCVQRTCQLFFLLVDILQIAHPQYWSSHFHLNSTELGQVSNLISHSAQPTSSPIEVVLARSTSCARDSRRANQRTIIPASSTTTVRACPTTVEQVPAAARHCGPRLAISLLAQKSYLATSRMVFSRTTFAAVLLQLSVSVFAHGHDGNMNDMDMGEGHSLAQPPVGQASSDQPTSYFDLSAHSRTMMAHIGLMVLAWFFILPVGKYCD